jgi:hypothetical protein
MNDEVPADRVVAVLLTDGWHQIVPGSFSVGPLDFGAGADVSVPGFRFADADAGRPYQPTTLAGPLASIIAVRQVATTVRRLGDSAVSLPTAHNGHRTDRGARLRTAAGR